MDIKQKSINEIMALAAEVVSNANSGHTGSAVGASSILYALFKDHLMFNPENPDFLNRDRLVMSAGHTSALYYSLLHLFGYKISSDDLKNFRKLGSKTPGHPEKNVTPGVEISTGPLGQGVANAVGLAIAETILENKLNHISPSLASNHTYCFCGDGCLMEGVAVEACSLAGTLALKKLIILYDDNNITIDGTRQSASGDDTAKKFEAMNFNTIIVKNGNDYKSCSKAIKSAKNSQKPTIIIFKTTIGYKTELAGSNKMHAHPMKPDELALFKETLGVNNSFGFSKDVYDFAHKTIQKNIAKYDKWNNYLITLKEENKKAFKEFKKALEPAKINFENILKKINEIGKQSGRKVASLILNLISNGEPSLVGGSADVAASTLAHLSNGGDYSKENRSGKNIHFGIREHAMGAICNGISLYNNSPVFCSTFLAFSNYMLPPIRMAAMMNAPVLSIFTHDTISVGEDGPTHQPIEQIGTLRSIIGLTTFRPSNNTETVAAFKYFIEQKQPTAIIMSKGNIDESPEISLEDAENGAYIIYENSKTPELVIISSGTEVELAIKTAKLLENTKVRVISMPCEKLFLKQTAYYQNKLLPKDAKVAVIEATNDNLWYKYVSDNSLLFNINEYQASGNGNKIMQKAGFDENKIAKAILKKL